LETLNRERSWFSLKEVVSPQLCTPTHAVGAGDGAD
jgi:hypothetical protein